MATKRGMGANPLERRSPAKKTGSRSGVVATLQAVPAGGSGLGEAHGAVLVPVDDLAPNPDNPAERSERPDPDLVGSVRQIGVLMPLVIISTAAFLEARPQHAEIVGDKPYVVLAGHQRRAAAIAAEVLEVPAVVRDDLAERADELVIHENVHRTALKPLQEAAAYGRMIERSGLSQRKLAEHLGVPQSQMSRRLSLLQLPEVLHAPVDAGLYEIKDALRLVEQIRGLDAREMEVALEILDRRLTELGGAEKLTGAGEWEWPVRRSFEDARARVRHEQAVAAAAALAESEGGLEVLEDPMAKFKHREHERELTSKKAIEAARKRGDLVVGVNRYDPESPKFYTTQKPERTVSDYEQGQRDLEKARKAARAHRREFLATVVATRGFTKAAAPVVSLALVTGNGLGSETTTLARKIATEAKIGPVDVTEDWAWRNAAATHEDRSRLAALIAVAAVENVVGSPYAGGGHVLVEYLTWLQGQGYEPTPTDQERVARYQQEQTRAMEQDAAAADEGDPTGSLVPGGGDPTGSPTGSPIKDSTEADVDADAGTVGATTDEEA